MDNAFLSAAFRATGLPNKCDADKRLSSVNGESCTSQFTVLISLWYRQFYSRLLTSLIPDKDSFRLGLSEQFVVVGQS